MMKTFEILKNLRKSHGFSQQYLANELEITRAAYTLYETGAGNVPAKRLQKLAELYGVTIDYLMGRESVHDECTEQVFEEKITERESKLLTYYRLLNSGLQQELDNYLMYLVTKNENLPPPPAKV